MKCQQGHTYQEMLTQKQKDYPGRATVISIQPKECPICKSVVYAELSDFYLVSQPKETPGFT